MHKDWRDEVKFLDSVFGELPSIQGDEDAWSENKLAEMILQDLPGRHTLWDL